MQQPIRNPQKRPGHFDRFEVLNLAPNDVVLDFYAAHDPVDSRYPQSGSAGLLIPPSGNFLQEPPQILPVPEVQPQRVECRVRITSDFTMEVVAPPGQYVGQVTFEVQGQNQWTPHPVFRVRD